MGFPHGALYIECTDILPVLLEQRDQEIDSAVDVSCQLVLAHPNMANGYCKTENLGGELVFETDQKPKITKVTRPL